jgi:hypothetical protein
MLLVSPVFVTTVWRLGDGKVMIAVAIQLQTVAGQGQVIPPQSIGRDDWI